MSTDLIEIGNDLRTFTIPSNLLLGVEHDKDVNEIKFVAPRYYHQDVDLSEFDIRIQHDNCYIASVKRTVCPRGRRNHKWLIHLAKR